MLPSLEGVPRVYQHLSVIVLSTACAYLVYPPHADRSSTNTSTFAMTTKHTIFARRMMGSDTLEASPLFVCGSQPSPMRPLLMAHNDDVRAAQGAPRGQAREAPLKMLSRLATRTRLGAESDSISRHQSFISNCIHLPKKLSPSTPARRPVNVLYSYSVLCIVIIRSRRNKTGFARLSHSIPPHFTWRPPPVNPSLAPAVRRHS